MITEQKLKEQCTPEFTKWMCEHAEGFGYIDYVLSQSSDLEQVRFNNIIFPLLIHRAVEGWNKLKGKILLLSSQICKIKDNEIKYYEMDDYQPENLTQAECACLHCLLDKFSEQEERDE